MFNTEFLDLPHLNSVAGSVRLPGSKSISNRVLLMAALSTGKTVVHDLLASDDTQVMLTALRELGCDRVINLAVYILLVDQVHGGTEHGREQHPASAKGSGNHPK